MAQPLVVEDVPNPISPPVLRRDIIRVEKPKVSHVVLTDEELVQKLPENWEEFGQIPDKSTIIANIKSKWAAAYNKDDVHATITNAIQIFTPLFESAKQNEGKLKCLAGIVLELSTLRLEIRAAVLEKMAWPNEVLKNSILTEFFSYIISEGNCTGYFENQEAHSHEVNVYLSRMFYKDFTEVRSISESLLEAIPAAVKRIVDAASQEGRTYSSIVLAVEHGFKMPKSMLNPILPLINEMESVVKISYLGLS